MSQIRDAIIASGVKLVVPVLPVPNLAAIEASWRHWTSKRTGFWNGRRATNRKQRRCRQGTPKWRYYHRRMCERFEARLGTGKPIMLMRSDGTMVKHQ